MGYESLFLQGKEKEAEFASMFKESSEATPSQDRKEHWDVKISYKIDVKGLKKIKRGDKGTQQEWHWIELKNVRGNKGWLYGEADMFAFELNKYWIVVSREKLAEFVAENVSKDMVAKAQPYKLYRRKGRLDLITLVSSYDLCYISEAMIPKEDEAFEIDDPD